MSAVTPLLSERFRTRRAHMVGDFSYRITFSGVVSGMKCLFTGRVDDGGSVEDGAIGEDTLGAVDPPGSGEAGSFHEGRIAEPCLEPATWFDNASVLIH